MTTNVTTGRQSTETAIGCLAQSIPISPEALSLGAWLLAILSAELASCTPSSWTSSSGQG